MRHSPRLGMVALSAMSLLPAIGACASGEQLLSDARAQIEIARHAMSADDLRFAGDEIGRNPLNPGDVVECSAAAIGKFLTGEAKSFQSKYDTYIYNATYTRALLPMGGSNYCVYLVRPVSRGLTVEEARDLFVAEHMTLPSYTPSVADIQAGEERFAELRKKAPGVRQGLNAQKRDAIEAIANRLVQCTDAELAANGTWNEHVHRVDYDELGIGEFTWGWSHSADGDGCIYNLTPLHRPLSVEEARDLLTLSRLPLPSAQGLAPITPGGAKRKSSGALSAPSVAEQKKNVGKLSGSDTRSRAASTSLPDAAKSIALVQYTGSDGKVHFGTAIQVSSYVFITAAHNIVDPGTFARNSNITVRPHYQLPEATLPIPASKSDIDPSYVNGDTIHKYGHDIGFIGVAQAVAGPMARPHTINSQADVGLNTGQYGCPLGQSQYDPLFIPGAASEPLSWFNGTIPSGGSSIYGCSPTRFASTYTLGYPVLVSGQANDEHFAYIDYGARFVGYGSQAPNQLYELEHPDLGGQAKTCSDCLPVEALKSWVSEGDSGGAVFGVANGEWTLLGILTNAVTNSSSIGALAAGDFDYNDPWIQSEIAWTPSGGTPPAVTITQPSDGAIYDRNSVPDLLAWAGSETSQIQWTSDIDGYLGTGGDVPVAGRLTPAGHTITASISGGGSSAQTAGVGVSDAVTVATVHVTVTGVTPPKITATPAQVVIPYGSTSAQTTISWTVLCDCKNWRTDIAYRLNGGSWVYWKNDARAGSDVFTVHAGDVIDFYAYQHHYDYTNSMRLTVTGVAGAPPTLNAPAQVAIPYGQNSANFQLTWNAPGYSQVSFYGMQNQQNPGQILCLGNIAESGSAPVGVNLGEHLTLWMLPYTGCAAGSIVSALPAAPLASATVDGVAGAVPTLSAPSQVTVPYGQNSTSFQMSWNAPGYAQVSFYGRQNLQNAGQILCLGNVAGAGTAPVTVSTGEYLTLWMLPNTACVAGSTVATLPAVVLATVSVSAVASPIPTLRAPSEVIIPSGSSSASFQMTWNAPGYSQVSFYGRQNLQNPGQILCLGSVPGTGAASVSVSVGEYLTLWMLPNTGCTAGAVVPALPAIPLASVAVSGVAGL